MTNLNRLLQACAITAMSHSAATPPQWRAAGTEWRLRVEQYAAPQLIQSAKARAPSNAEPRIAAAFTMTVRVLEPAVARTGPVARFQFTPDPGAPADMNGQVYTLSVDLETGQVTDLALTGGRFPGSSAIESAEDKRALFTTIFGFPVDWIVSAADLRPQGPEEAHAWTVGEGSRLHSARRVLPNSLAAQPAMAVEAAINHSNDGPKHRVIQTWVPGEPWWRTFARYRDGHFELTATRTE